jgi:hypothetical protein
MLPPGAAAARRRISVRRMPGLHFRLGRVRTLHGIDAEMRLLGALGGRFAIRVASRWSRQVDEPLAERGMASDG